MNNTQREYKIRQQLKKLNHLLDMENDTDYQLSVREYISYWGLVGDLGMVGYFEKL
jgi:hypothetical protein